MLRSVAATTVSTDASMALVIRFGSAARVAQHGVQRAERLVDEREAELLHVVEVAVEGGGGDAGFLA